jgi:hypothetical protein
VKLLWSACWWCACAPFRVVGWLLLAAVAVLAAFDHDDDPGGQPWTLGKAQKPFPMKEFGRVWPGEHRGGR